MATVKELLQAKLNEEQRKTLFSDLAGLGRIPDMEEIEQALAKFSVTMSEEEKAIVLASLTADQEVSDEALDNVAGGCRKCGDERHGYCG